MRTVMTSFVRAAAVAAFLACSAVTAERAMAQTTTTSPLGHSKVEFAYFPPKNMKYQPVMNRLKSRQVLEVLSQFLTPLRLPHTFYLVTMECERENASPFYSGDLRAIVMCYEFIDLTDRIAPKPGQQWQDFTHDEVVVGAFVGVLLHEVGHAVFHMLDVPLFGREEDAADQMAGFLALQFNTQVARTVIRGYAYIWAAFGNPKEWAQYAGEHGTSSQRFYNTLCLAYGADPKTFKDFIDRNWLPKERAENCASEYQQVKTAFAKTILPFIDPELMKKVQARDWLKPPGGR
jgi:Putative metallopeptidase